MQKGIATLEIVLAVIIIGILAKVAVPNAVQIIDAASLDYETKRFYSELRFLQTLNRSTQFSRKGFGDNDNLPAGTNLIVVLKVDNDGKSYQLLRGTTDDASAVREPHTLSNGVTIFFGKKEKHVIKSHFDVTRNMITADESGKATDISGTSLNGTITLTSRLGRNRYIIFDNVGRIRSSLTPPNN